MAALPTAEQLKEIPLYGIIAYTARCSQRVQFLYSIDEKHPDASSSTEAVHNAIQLASAFASGKSLAPETVSAAEEAVIRAVMLVSQGETANKLSALAANSAYASIHATGLAMSSQNAASKATEANQVVMAAMTAAEAAAAADSSVKNPASRDWSRLHRMRLGAYPELGKPVDPSSEGTLGPVLEERQNTQPAAKEEAKETGSTPQPEQRSPAKGPKAAAGGIDPRELLALKKQLESELKRVERDRAELENAKTQIQEQEQALAQERGQLGAQADSGKTSGGKPNREVAALEKKQEKLEAENKKLKEELSQQQKGGEGSSKSKPRLDKETQSLEKLREQLDAIKNEMKQEADKLKAERKQFEKDTQQMKMAAKKFDSIIEKYPQILEPV